jgi:hypothetical protein
VIVTGVDLPDFLLCTGVDQRNTTAIPLWRPAAARRDQSPWFILNASSNSTARHPRKMDIGQVAQFLDHLAQTESDPVRNAEARVRHTGGDVDPASATPKQLARPC